MTSSGQTCLGTHNPSFLHPSGPPHTGTDRRIPTLTFPILLSLQSVHARLYTWYALRHLALTAPLVTPTADDMAAFAREHPAEAVEVGKLQAVGRVSGVAGLAGAVAVGANSWKHNRMAAYLAVGGVLGGLAATLVADDVRLRLLVLLELRMGLRFCRKLLSTDYVVDVGFSRS